MAATEFATPIVFASLAYIAALLVIATLSRRARREDTLSDFYLAGRSLGPMVLLLTLFATQYSGNSLSGFPGQTYREGLAYYMSVPFMVTIVSGYLLFAPGLYRAARAKLFITPTDFLADRYQSPLLNGLSALILCLALVNFLLAQLMAMGHAFSGLTGGQVPYAAGVIGGATVILAYELLGGMRAVAWTDAVQGMLLFVGLTFVVVLVVAEIGTPAEVVRIIAANSPEKAANPSFATCRTWLSNVILIGLGAPLYPQAIQRIYAARKLSELRRALAIMAFVPHFAISTVIFLGVVGIALFPGLDRAASDQITFRVLAHLVEVEPLAFLPVLCVMLAVVAAIMSTADSCLLSLSSILTRDVVGRARRYRQRRAEGTVSGEQTVASQQGATSEQLSSTSAWLSVIVMSVLVLIALRPLTTLWNLLILKFEILIQLSPAFILGAQSPTSTRAPIGKQPIVCGLLAGLATALGLFFTGYRQIGNFHAGVIGLAVNYALVFALDGIRRRSVA